MKKFMLTIATVVSASIIFAGCASKNEETKVSETTEQVVDTTDIIGDVVEEEPVATEESVAEDSVEDVVASDDSTEDVDVVEDDTIDLSFLMGDYEDIPDRSIFTRSYDHAWCTAYSPEDKSIVAITLKDGALTDDSEVYPGVTFKTFCDGLDDVLDHPVNREMLRMTLSLYVLKTTDDLDDFTAPVVVSDYLYFIENPTTMEVCLDDNNAHNFITVDDEFTFKFTITLPDGEILINDKESDFPTVTEEVENSYKSKIETALGL